MQHLKNDEFPVDWDQGRKSFFISAQQTNKRTITNDHFLTQSLDSQVEKYSPTLGRNASYTQKSRLTRLPGYLTVHMVRFAWKADIEKKAKIVVCKTFESFFG